MKYKSSDLKVELRVRTHQIVSEYLNNNEFTLKDFRKVPLHEWKSLYQIGPKRFKELFKVYHAPIVPSNIYIDRFDKTAYFSVE